MELSGAGIDKIELTPCLSAGPKDGLNTSSTSRCTKILQHTNVHIIKAT